MLSCSLLPWEQKGQNPGCGPAGRASLCDLGQKPCPLWARVAELTALLLSLPLWKALLFTPGLQALRGLCPSTSRCRPQRTGRPHCLAGSGWRELAGREKAGGAGVTGTGWAWAIAQLGSLARPGLHRPPLPPVTLPPSSALQTFLSNLGCCSPGRGNCRRHSTRQPETLNPFLASRQSPQAGGWGWAWVPRLRRDPLRCTASSPGGPQVSNLDQQAICGITE